MVLFSRRGDLNRITIQMRIVTQDYVLCIDGRHAQTNRAGNLFTSDVVHPQPVVRPVVLVAMELDNV